MNALELIVVEKDGKITFYNPTSLDLAARDFRSLQRNCASMLLHRVGSREIYASHINYNHFKICGF